MFWRGKLEPKWIEPVSKELESELNLFPKFEMQLACFSPTDAILNLKDLLRNTLFKQQGAFLGGLDTEWLIVWGYWGQTALCKTFPQISASCSSDICFNIWHACTEYILECNTFPTNLVFFLQYLGLYIYMWVSFAGPNFVLGTKPNVWRIERYCR